MDMNLCLSGLAPCYAKVRYPAVVHEAISRIRAARPDAVTFTEACGGDVALICPANRLQHALFEGDLRRQAPALHSTGRPWALR